ncbi:hypothetical protein J518_4235 [Acinetobacter baumannii 1419130]|nr:hypothetical protein J518_4235 [Acinetobacter baumannii 1419130]
MIEVDAPSNTDNKIEFLKYEKTFNYCCTYSFILFWMQ